MRIDIVFPKVGSPKGGISDHSASIASGLLARGHSVRLLGRGTPSARLPASYENVWPDENLRNMGTLVDAIARNKTELLIFQFEQFSYGRRGLNPALLGLFRSLKNGSPGLQILLYAHEAYTSPTSLKRALMWSYQRLQAQNLASTADLVFHSSTRGLRLLGKSNVQSSIVPVHSNIDLVEPSRLISRTDLGLPPNAFLTLAFGYLNRFRVDKIRDAFAAIRSEREDALLVYVGKEVGQARALTSDRDAVRILDAPSAEVVSSVMLSSDLALSPFEDGVSLRRGTFAALMKHGIPTITTRGRDTDDFLVTCASHGAFALTSNARTFAVDASALASGSDTRDRMRRISRESFHYIQSLDASLDAIETSMTQARNQGKK